MIPLLLVLVGLFMPKSPEWTSFQEPKKSPVQQRFVDVATFLWPAVYIAVFLALAVTDSGGDPSAALPATITLMVSLLLNAVIYVGIGLILWFLGEVFSGFFQRRSRNYCVSAIHRYSLAPKVSTPD